MSAGALVLAGVAVMVVSLFLTPLGLPGNWIMIGVLAVGAITGRIGAAPLIGLLLVAIAADVVEFFIVKRLNTRYGGSNRAFWGAIAGGVIGVVVGMPVPVLGSILAGLAGTFAGAVAVTLLERRTATAAARVGWGVLIGRAFSAAAKTAAGVVILVLGSAALIW
jgi:uncharacterized protein YqgC (DUF456 family)